MRVTLKTVCSLIRGRVRADWDVVCVITGQEGVGKSTCAYWVGEGSDTKFDLEKSFIFSPNTSDVIKQVKSLHRYGVVVMDEGIKMAYKGDWQKRVQKRLNKVYTLNRNENKITIICIPNLADLTKFFRQWRVFLWIHVYARGKAVVFVKIDVPFGGDPWELEKNHKLYLKTGRKLIFDEDARVDKLRRVPYFMGEISFPPIPESVMEKYVSLKNKFKYEDEEEDEVPESKMKRQRDILISTLVLLGVSTLQIGKALGITRRSIQYAVGKAKGEMEVQELLQYITNEKEVSFPKK